MTKNEIVGVWRLESFELGSGPSANPWGNQLRGLLFYTADGFVSVGINRNVGEPNFEPSNDSLFYAGTFTFRGGQIVHKIQVATNAQRIDSEMIRDAQLFGEKLILTGKSESAVPFHLVWRKI